MLPPNDIQASAGAGKTGSLTERLCRQAKAQPLKAATTGLLVCVLLALLLRGTLQPGKASAGNVARALLPTATPSAPGLLSPEALLQVAMPALAAVQAHSTPPLPPRDIFAVDLRRFPKIGSPQVEEPLEACPRTCPMRRRHGWRRSSGRQGRFGWKEQ